MLDITRSLLVKPAQHGGSAHFHQGFLFGVREDAVLHERLRRHLQGSSLSLYVIGHSLGGSLAMTLVAADMLPPTFRGSVTCVAIGSPPVLYGAPAPGSMGRSEAARVLLFVNDSDIIPRLMGSPLPAFATTLFATSLADTHEAERAQTIQQSVATLEQYVHMPQTELVLLKNGGALRVAREQFEAVLHVHEAFSLNLVEHHKVKSYVDSLRKAMTSAGATPMGTAVPPQDVPMGVAVDGGAQHSSRRDSTAESPASTECVVCLSAAPTHAFVPCGHRCVCNACGNAISQGSQSCPICRAHVSSTLRVFLAS